MLRLKVRTIGEGQHPSEAIVSLRTADGDDEEIIIDKRSVRDDTVKIGYPISQDGNRLLVELPRETMRGAWRVWVDKNSVEEAA